ncbi:hypothetical protein PMAYCL1PPCAC_00116, partial [Pristionchus mayeri]
PLRHFTKQNVTVAVNVGMATTEMKRSKRAAGELNKQIMDALMNSVQQWTESGDIGVRFIWYSDAPKQSLLFDTWPDAMNNMEESYHPRTVTNTNQTLATQALQLTEDSDSLMLVVPESTAYSEQDVMKKDSLGAGNILNMIDKEKVIIFAPNMERSSVEKAYNLTSTPLVITNPDDLTDSI